MAVLDSCPEVKATIRSEGMSLKEYDDPEVDARVTAQQKTVVKFVECRPGAEFSIRFTISDRLRRRSDYISALVTINGEQEVHTAFYAPRRYPFRDKWTCQVDGIQNVDSQGALLKTFKFAELEITEDDDPVLLRKAKQALVNMGTIQVKVLELLGVRRDDPVSRVYEEFRKHAPEKALKKGNSISLTVGHGETERVARSQYISHRRSPSLDHPLAVFIFKYRTRSDLEREMIIPRPTTPVVVDDDDYVWELVRVRRKTPAGMKRKHAEIKQEDEPERRVKHRYPEKVGEGGRIEVDLEGPSLPSSPVLGASTAPEKAGEGGRIEVDVEGPSLSSSLVLGASTAPGDFLRAFW